MHEKLRKALGETVEWKEWKLVTSGMDKQGKKLKRKVRVDRKDSKSTFIQEFTSHVNDLAQNLHNAELMLIFEHSTSVKYFRSLELPASYRVSNSDTLPVS